MTTDSRTIRRRRTAAALLLSAGLVLSACGGTGEDAAAPVDEPATTETAEAEETEAEETEAEPTEAEETRAGGTGAAEEPEAGAGEVTVTAVDFDYELPTTEFSAGELTIELVNEGGASHNIVVERDGEDVAESEVIGSGETTTLTVDLEPGEYVFYCSVGNHRALGMEVPVTVG